MTFKDYINEEHFTWIDGWKGSVEILKNPSPIEVFDLIKHAKGSYEIRGLWDDTRQTLYIWDGSGSLHADVEFAIEKTFKAKRKGYKWYQMYQNKTYNRSYREIPERGRLAWKKIADYVKEILG